MAQDRGPADEAGPLRTTQSFCRICGALCGIKVTTVGDRVLDVKGDADHPLSQGYICAKGRAAGVLHHGEDRLDFPEMIGPGGRSLVNWEACLDDLAGRIRTVVDRHGRDSVAVYTGTYTGFDSLGGLAATSFLASIGTCRLFTPSTIDAVIRRYVLGLISGYPSGVLFPIPDYTGTRCMILVGTNPVISHGASGGFTDPVRRIRAIRGRGEVWVLDPRTTETAKLATGHLAVRAGTDYAVLGFLVRELLAKGADRDYLDQHVSGADALADLVRRFDRDSVAAITGIGPDALAALLEGVRQAGRAAVLTGTGVTMSTGRAATEYLAWALGAVTGSLDRPGGVWFNPSFIRRVDDAASAGMNDMARFQLRRTGFFVDNGEASRLSDRRPLGEVPCAFMAEQIERRDIRALIAIGGDPMTAFPQPARLASAFGSLDALAVLDVRRSATAALATHLLPCAGQLERADFSLMDGMYAAVAAQFTPALVRASAGRRPMWWILAQLAARLGLDVLPPSVDAATACDEDVARAFLGDATFRRLSASTTLVVESGERFGWFVDGGFLPDNRWNFAHDEIRDLFDRLPSPSELVLIPGRRRRRFNSVAISPADDHDATLLVHPLDAHHAGIADGNMVTVRSTYGEVTVRAQLSEGISRGAVWLPHGYASPAIGSLTSDTELLDAATGMVTQSGVPVELIPGPRPPRIG